MSLKVNSGGSFGGAYMITQVIIRHKSDPLRNTSLLNMSHHVFELSRSLKIKSDDAVGSPDI